MCQVNMMEFPENIPLLDLEDLNLHDFERLFNLRRDALFSS